MDSRTSLNLQVAAIIIEQTALFSIHRFKLFVTVLPEKSMLRISTFLAVVLPFCAAAYAQEPEVILRRQLYGRGVHAYFAGEPETALAFFNQAIKLGSKDPRVYYYRGLATLATDDENRAKTAQQDFQQGAKFEVQDPDGFFAVGMALERVQGRARLAIEGARRTARRDAQLLVQEELGRRYNRIKQAEPDVVTPPPSADPEVKKTFNPFEEKAPEPPAPMEGTPMEGS